MVSEVNKASDMQFSDIVSGRGTCWATNLCQQFDYYSNTNFLLSTKYNLVKVSSCSYYKILKWYPRLFSTRQNF